MEPPHTASEWIDQGLFNVCIEFNNHSVITDLWD